MADCDLRPGSSDLRHCRLFPAGILLGLMAACAPGPSEPPTERSTNPIVAGERELGYPAIGALVLDLPDDDRTGSFCSATLIDPGWVLTAAHCIDGARNRLGSDDPPFEPTFVSFLIGDDARTRNENVRLVPAAQIYVHPAYRDIGGDLSHDVALIELAEPAPDDVIPIPIFRGDLTAELGSDVFYAGFGVNQGDGGGGGVKRSTTLRLAAVQPNGYVTQQIGGGVCFGDSGGPGVLQTPNGEAVIGVNSTVIGAPLCEQYSTQMRVDSFQSWIDATMGREFNDCRTNVFACQCPEACGEDGVCNNSACGQALCQDILLCFGRCFNSGCQASCLLDSTPQAYYAFEEYTDCLNDECPNNRTAECIEENCRRELRTCQEGLDATTGDATCGDLALCSRACGPDDRQCLDDCFYQGQLQAQRQLTVLDACVEILCDGETPQTSSACALTCRSSLLTCMPDEGCRLAGGDCPAGSACRVERWGATYCRTTRDLPVGEPCTLGRADECVDGALCLQTDDTGPRCHELCATALDCELSEPVCSTQVVDDFPIGACAPSCFDADEDGACDVDDCAPDDPAISPLAEEICDPDGIDEDCSGAGNEGCDPCEFGDGGPACASPDAGFAPTAAPVPDDADSGCGCATAERSRGSAVPFGLLAVLGGAWLLRRRRGAWLAALLLATACSASEETTLAPALPEPETFADASVDAGFAPPPPDAGFVDGGATLVETTIFELQQGRAGRGYQVIIRDVVIVSPVTERGFFVSDASGGPFSGIFVVATSTPGPALPAAWGDRVDITATLEERAFGDAADPTQTRTELRFESPDDIVVTGRADQEPAPVDIAPTVVALRELAEPFEGVLVRLPLTSVSERDLATGVLELDGLVATDSLLATLQTAWYEPGHLFSSVTGILHFSDIGFHLLPRRDADLTSAPRDLQDCLPTDGYLVCPARARWNQAREDCARRGGRLVLTKTATINDIVSRASATFAEGVIWIGASDAEVEGDWRWTDGSTLAYSSWANNEPNNSGGSQNCAVTNFRAVGLWDDQGCGVRRAYVCEFLAPPPTCSVDSDCAAGMATCIDGSCR